MESLISLIIDENLCKKKDVGTSSMIWHQRWNHISQDIMLRLVKDEVVSKIDFLDFYKCIKCLKWNKERSARSHGLLKLIYTSILDLFQWPIWS